MNCNQCNGRIISGHYFPAESRLNEVVLWECENGHFTNEIRPDIYESIEKNEKMLRDIRVSQETQNE